MIEGDSLEIEYLTWNFRPWKASIRTNPAAEDFYTFNHIGTDVHTELFIKYIAYNGEAWTAKVYVADGIFYFLHSNSDGREHPDTIIRFLGWDGVSQWSASLKWVAGELLTWHVRRTE